jgi:ferredoxin
MCVAATWLARCHRLNQPTNLLRAGNGCWPSDMRIFMPTSACEPTRVLSNAQIEQFIQDGFVRIDRAFPRQLADEGRAILWRDLPCHPDDPATWTQPVIRLGHYGDEPFKRAANSPVLQARGVPAFEIFKERFRSPAPPALDGLMSRQIHFARSARTLTWSPQAPLASILAVAESAGIAIPSGCRVGQCESCTVPITTGEVCHLVDCSELDEEHCLTCQAVPLSDLVIDA